MDEPDSEVQNKNIQINSKNLTKKVSERVSDDSSNHSSQFKFHKIKNEQMNIIEFQESSLKVRKYLISEYDESEDDFMILMKNGNNLYFVNNYIEKEGYTEMMIDTPNFSIQIRRRQNDSEYPELEGKAIREEMQRQSIYESFLLEFPFDDKSFSDGHNIIYITPVNTPDCNAYLDEKKAFRFIEYYNKMLDENKIIDIFYPDKIDKFVSLIYQNRLSLHEVQSKSFSLSKFQNKYNIILLEQLCNKINSLFDYINIYKNWGNSYEKKNELIQIYSILIHKLIHTIICVQKCLQEYENYVKHCTKPLNLYPKLKLEEIIRLNKYDGMKLKDIINEEKKYLS